MEKSIQRIEYVDALRGLCMVLIVWYHTNHPALLDYPFYNTALFFVSGMLFKPSNFPTFLRKKFWKLLIPFLFFYVLYYFFLIIINFAKYRTVSYEIFSSILDVFRFYKDNVAYICNYPLWFLWALFWVQLICNYLIIIIRKPFFLFLTSLIVSVIGYVYIQHIPTPFIIGRSFTFVIYYISGFLFCSLLNNKFNNKIILLTSVLVWILALGFRTYIMTPILSTILYCIEFVSIAIVLLQLCRIVSFRPFIHALSYFGINSLIVFGMHDMYLSICRIITTNLFGEMNITLGCVNWILTLLFMLPTIYILNKHFPVLVGKKIVSTI